MSMTDTTRRAVVLSAGGAGLAVALSACTGYSTGGGSSAAAPADKPTTAKTEGSGDGGKTKGPGEGEETKGSGDAPAVAAIAQTGDIPKGGGKILESEKIVITQPSDGEFKAFSAICTHQGCTVGSVSNGTINCPCHGSKFNIKDGSVADGPATKPLAETKISVDGDSITLA
jgi:Rieske Fe-S protein